MIDRRDQSLSWREPCNNRMAVDGSLPPFHRSKCARNNTVTPVDVCTHEFCRIEEVVALYDAGGSRLGESSDSIDEVLPV